MVQVDKFHPVVFGECHDHLFVGRVTQFDQRLSNAGLCLPSQIVRVDHLVFGDHATFDQDLYKAIQVGHGDSFGLTRVVQNTVRRRPKTGIEPSAGVGRPRKLCQSRQYSILAETA